jgi:hypothetical protein
MEVLSPATLGFRVSQPNRLPIKCKLRVRASLFADTVRSPRYACNNCTWVFNKHSVMLLNYQYPH